MHIKLEFTCRFLAVVNLRERSTLQGHAYNSGKWVENIAEAVSDVSFMEK